MRIVCPKNLLFLFIYLTMFLPLNAQKLKFEGVYSGKKMAIFNPLSNDYIGTCMQRITVNGDIYPINVSSNYLEIDLKRVGVEKDDLFNLVIEHKVDCSPIILNPYDFKSHEKGIIKDLKLHDLTLTWTSEGEITNADYVVEYRYKNRWYPLTNILSKGAGNQFYTFEIPFMVSGKNELRIYKQNLTSPRYYFANWENPEVHYRIASISVSRYIFILKNSNKLPTFYRLRDQHGVIVKSGFGDEINVSNLNSGFYRLDFNDMTTVIIKK